MHMIPTSMSALRNLLLTFATAASCSIICGTACDFIEPGECLGPAELFGPCREGTCSDGLSCLTLDLGDICLPPEIAATDDYVVECAQWRGTLGCNQKTDQCYLQCESDSECTGGTLCATDQQRCVYPYPTASVQ